MHSGSCFLFDGFYPFLDSEKTANMCLTTTKWLRLPKLSLVYLILTYWFIYLIGTWCLCRNTGPGAHLSLSGARAETPHAKIYKCCCISSILPYIYSRHLLNGLSIVLKVTILSGTVLSKVVIIERRNYARLLEVIKSWKNRKTWTLLTVLKILVS